MQNLEKFCWKFVILLTNVYFLIYFSIFRDFLESKLIYKVSQICHAYNKSLYPAEKLKGQFQFTKKKEVRSDEKFKPPCRCLSVPPKLFGATKSLFTHKMACMDQSTIMQNLENFRRQKRMKTLKQSVANGLSRLWSFTFSRSPSDGGQLNKSPSSDVSGPTACDNGGSTRSWQRSIFFMSLWAICYLLAVLVGFGAVYFIVSLLVFICLNTRNSNRAMGTTTEELSAYSVFNKNCERLPGTLTAEQFEKTLRNGGMLTH